MRKFYFHVLDGTTRRDDQTGVYCRDENAALQVAINLARELGVKAKAEEFSYVEFSDDLGTVFGSVKIPPDA